jgi:para-nitrobenzyl esterase
MAKRFRVVLRFAACMVAAHAALGGAAARATYDEHPVFALTERGFVKGIQTPTMKKFLGIPYAEPPLGALRWQPPQRVADWVWLRDATQFANHCPQPASFFGLPSVAEDCLYLNVYAPNHRGWGFDLFQKHPVMVFIHGGSLFVGESDDYDPTRLVEREDVMVVTINYRLGVLGFLPHPALSAEAPYGGSGNYGFMDQQAALQWVQRNIRSFGGDPGNVTIFGESAGGLSVFAQLASPGATGLFHRAIIQSGASGVAATAPLATAEARGVAFAIAVGCPDQTAACLRSVPVETMLAKQATSYAGTIDGKVLTQPIRDALAKGEFSKVPVMQGTNHDEWRLFVGSREVALGPLTAAQYQGAMVNFGFSPALAAYLATYVYPLAAYPSPSIAFGAVVTDYFFACKGRDSVRLLANHVPVYVYEFNDPEPPQPYLPPVSFPYGAFHAGEIQYVMGVRPAVEPVAPFTADQARLSDVMTSYWGRFARDGNPNSWHTPDWAPYDPATDLVQSLVPPEPTPKADFAADHKCAFWTPGS